jgi:hypothetical protein
MDRRIAERLSPQNQGLNTVKQAWLPAGKPPDYPDGMQRSSARWHKFGLLHEVDGVKVSSWVSASVH